MRVFLLYSTVYYPQIDNASKYINQIVEIALRFHVYIIPNLAEWPNVLPAIQGINNNTPSTAIGKSLNKFACRFMLNRSVDQIDCSFELSSKVLIPLQLRKEAKDSMNFTHLVYKKNYNRAHQPIFLEINNLVLLYLHKSYKIPVMEGIIIKLTQLQIPYY